MALTEIPIELSSTPGIVDNSNATAITIDSSENVMVGTTDTAPGAGDTNAGVSIRGGSDNRSFFSVNGDYVMHLNRNTNDGNILEFAKNGTNVASIGTNAATMYVSAPQAGGMKYSYLTSTNAVMLPVTTTGASADGTHDLGLPGGRFRDIYLSGGVNFSVNANAGGMTSETLDDYEEGAWTPTVTGDSGSTSGQSYGTVTGHYVKIGQLVYLGFDISLTAAGSLGGSYAVVSNLPFPALSSNLGGGSMGFYTDISNATGPITFYVAASQGYLMKGGSTYVASSDITNSTRVIGFLSYRTSA